MPVTCVKRGEKWRLVNTNTGMVEKTDKGNARDGGGHVREQDCRAQAAAMNANTENR